MADERGSEIHLPSRKRHLKPRLNQWLTVGDGLYRPERPSEPVDVDAPLPTLGERQRIDKVGGGWGAGAVNGGRFGVFNLGYSVGEGRVLSLSESRCRDQGSDFLRFLHIVAVGVCVQHRLKHGTNEMEFCYFFVASVCLHCFVLFSLVYGCVSVYVCKKKSEVRKAIINS